MAGAAGWGGQRAWGGWGVLGAAAPGLPCCCSCPGPPRRPAACPGSCASTGLPGGRGSSRSGAPGGLDSTLALGAAKGGCCSWGGAQGCSTEAEQIGGGAEQAGLPSAGLAAASCGATRQPAALSPVLCSGRSCVLHARLVLPGDRSRRGREQARSKPGRRPHAPDSAPGAASRAGASQRFNPPSSPSSVPALLPCPHQQNHRLKWCKRCGVQSRGEQGAPTRTAARRRAAAGGRRCARQVQQPCSDKTGYAERYSAFYRALGPLETSREQAGCSLGVARAGARALALRRIRAPLGRARLVPRGAHLKRRKPRLKPILGRSCTGGGLGQGHAISPRGQPRPPPAPRVGRVQGPAAARRPKQPSSPAPCPARPAP